MTWAQTIDHLEKMVRDVAADEMPAAWRGFSHQERIEKIIAAEQDGSDGVEILIADFLFRGVLPPLTAEQKWFFHWRILAAIALCSQLEGECVSSSPDTPKVILLVLTKHWQKNARAIWRRDFLAVPDSNPETPLPPSN
jgi:hypothetical protein